MITRSVSNAVLVSGLLCSGALFEGCSKKVAVATPPQSQAPVASAAPAPASPAPRQQTPPPARPTQTASAKPAPRVPDQATKDRIQALIERIQDAYFDYNTSNIRADAQAALRADAQTLSEILKDYPTYRLTIQGYADERGSAEYNLALGEQRAKRAKQYLVDSGIPDAQLVTMSYGKERPVCEEHQESCWQKNRRIHITQAQS